MPLKLDIPENLIEPTREVYRNAAKATWAKLTQANNEWAEIKPLLAQLGILSEFETPTNSLTNSSVNIPFKNSTTDFTIWDEFKDARTWLKKAEFVIKKRGASTATEIIEFIKEKIDPNFDVELAGNSIPATLSVAAKEGKIQRDRKSNGEFVYDTIK